MTITKEDLERERARVARIQRDANEFLVSPSDVKEQGMASARFKALIDEASPNMKGTEVTPNAFLHTIALLAITYDDECKLKEEIFYFMAAALANLGYGDGVDLIYQSLHEEKVDAKH